MPGSQIDIPNKASSTYPDLSVIVPAYNEAENIALIFSELQRVLGGTPYSYEIIFVDDGSTDLSFKHMMAVKGQYTHTRVVRFRANKGKSEALSAGFRLAGGRKIVTIDADLQESPEEIPRLVAELDKGYDLISGWRHKRRDSRSKVFSSWLFNAFVRVVTGTPFHDINCGLKIYRKEVIKSTHLYGELHRVIPLLVSENGFHVGEMKVTHQPRQHGVSKFTGLFRGFHGFFDLLSVLFLARYEKKPMHFFGMAGAILFTFGLIVNLFLTLRYFMGFGFIGERLPLLLLGILSMILGFQSFCMGLVGEMLVRRHHTRSNDSDEEIHP